nr:putative ribonuclease H-like domain-containing protein [Tanacetum cinerariifolium]
MQQVKNKPQDHCSTEVPEGNGNPNPTASKSNPPADQMETLTVETPIPTINSPIPTAYSTDSQEPSSDARLMSKRVANQVETPSLDNILSLTNRFEDILKVTTNSNESNGVAAHISNMETAITTSPTPTLRIHKDHPKSQIIGPMDTPIQTRNKSKEVEEQKPKKISDALQDPNWVEAMQEFEVLMHEKFQMNAMGELNFFFGLQVLQKEDVIFLSQDKYVDSDYGGATQDRKSTTRECQFLGRRLISWQCKKQTIVATSTTEAEYVAAAIAITVSLVTNSSNTSSSLLFHPNNLVIMARLAFCDYHNMVVILEKYEQNTDFHQIVDFVGASHIRHNLKLTDEEGLSSLPDTELFENLTLMGYNISPNQKFNFQKGQFSHQWKFFIHTIMQCLRPKSTGFNEFSSNIATALELTDFCTSLQRQQFELVSKFIAQALEITRLKARVKFLEDRQGEGINLSRDDAPIKGMRLDAEEVATERVSSDTKEIRLNEGEVAAERVVPTASAVAPANVSISTGSGVVPTASTTISTATPIFATATTVTPYTRRKGKEKMVETHTPKKKKRLQEEIDIQDKEIAKIHAEEELQQMIEGQQRKTKTKKQKRDFYMAVVRNNLGWKVKDFKGMSFEEDEAKFKTGWEQIKGGVSKISKGEAAWLKRKGIRSEQEKKNYPLRKALALVMICYKLQVENYSQMATDLVRKIQQIAGTPSLQVTKFPLPKELPTAREDSCHCQKKKEATARKITLLSMSRRNCQSKVAVTLIADEPASPLRDVSQGEACPTDSSFIADQDRANIVKTSTLPHDSAPRVTSPVAAEGKITRLKARVKLLEDKEEVAAEGSKDNAPIKGRNFVEGEAATERVSDDTEEMATVLTSMDAATVLASEATEVPTGSGSIPTAGPPATEVLTGSDVVPTASPIFSTATVIDAQVARELEEQLEREDQRMSEQIARDAEVARIHVEEELQSMIDGLDRSNETVAKYQDNYVKIHKYHSQQRKPWSKKQKRDYYMAVIRSNLGSKVKDFRVPEEKIKEMMQLVPIEEVYIEALQVKHPIIDLKVHTEGQRAYWNITRLGGSSASYQFFIDLLKHLDRKDLNQLWSLVKESLSNRTPTSDKEMELWVELKRLYEPDVEDQLWTHTQHQMHALVEWKLYDICGVHQVTSKDK